MIQQFSTRAASGDEGVASIFVIVALLALLLATGLAIDVGQYVAAARSAQNSSDATVLAVATDCALSGAPVANYSVYHQGDQTISTPACGAGVATITTTQEVTGRLLNVTAGSVQRTAEARWGTLGSANTAPITVANCEFVQALPSATATSAEDIVIYLDDTKPQTGCSSLPGGFSQLISDGCDVTVTAGSSYPGDPGADLQKIVPCITNPDGSLGRTVLIPLYNAAACAAADCTGKGPYLMLGFAAFKITGYRLNGNNVVGFDGKQCPDQDRGRYCLKGDFVTYTTEGGAPGDGGDYGVTVVYLSK